MPIRLNDMLAREKAAQVTYDDDVIDFAYYPNRLTLEVQEGIYAAAEADDLSAVTAGLGPVISWWDVLDENDQRIPATAEQMRKFPLPFLLAVMGAIQDDTTPTAPKG